MCRGLGEKVTFEKKHLQVAISSFRAELCDDEDEGDSFIRYFLLRPLAGAKYCNLFDRYAKMSNIIPKYHTGQYISETRKDRAKVTVLWMAYRNLPTLFRTVPSPTHYGLPFHKIGGSQPPV